MYVTIVSVSIVLKSLYASIKFEFISSNLSSDNSQNVVTRWGLPFGDRVAYAELLLLIDTELDFECLGRRELRRNPYQQLMEAGV